MPAARGRRPDDGEDARADDGADAQRDQLDRAEHPLHLVPGVLRLGEDPVDRLRAEELVHAEMWAEDISRGARRIRDCGGRRDRPRPRRPGRPPVAPGSPRASGSGRRCSGAGPCGRAAAPAGPAAVAPSKSSRGESPTWSASAGATSSLRQVRRKISASGLPVCSIAETDTTPKRPAQALLLEQRGRYESQFETIASARPRAAELVERRHDVVGRRPTSRRSRKCDASVENASSVRVPPSRSDRDAVQEAAPEVGLARTPP